MTKEIKDRIAQLNKGDVPNGYKNAGFGIFPCDWVTDKKLGDLGTFGKGQGLPGYKTFKEGLPCVRYGDIYTLYNNFHFKKAQNFIDEETAAESLPVGYGTLLFTGTGETAEEIGKCVCYNGHDIIHVGGDIITFTTNEVNSLFLAYQQYQNFSLKQKARWGQGHSVVHIQKNSLEKLNVAYPKLPAEQAKIAEILMKWDEAIELQEQYIEKLETYKKSIMKIVLSTKDHWTSKKMIDIGDLYQPTTISEDVLSDVGYTVYGANGIIGYYHSYNHEDSQIAITCRGSTCGNVTLTKPKSWITGNAMVFKVNELKYDKLFMYYYCCFIGFKNFISGSGQPQITRQALQKMNFIIPENIVEQAKISKLLCSYDDSIKLQIEKFNLLKQQRKALQQYLLTGIVRV